MVHRTSPLSFTEHRLRSRETSRGRSPQFNDALNRASQSLMGYAEIRRDDFALEVAGRVEELERRIGKMRDDGVVDEARHRDLDAKLAEARRQLEAARAGGGSNWSELRDGTVSAWRALSESVQAAVEGLVR